MIPPTASPTSAVSPLPTPSALPSNPASVTTTEIYANIQRGALIILGMFVIFGVALRLRRS